MINEWMSFRKVTLLNLNVVDLIKISPSQWRKCISRLLIYPNMVPINLQPPTRSPRLFSRTPNVCMYILPPLQCIALLPNQLPLTVLGSIVLPNRYFIMWVIHSRHNKSIYMYVYHCPLHIRPRPQIWRWPTGVILRHKKMQRMRKFPWQKS